MVRSNTGAGGYEGQQAISRPPFEHLGPFVSMSLLDRFMGRLRSGSRKASGSSSVNLVDDVSASSRRPDDIGINRAPEPMPWTVSRLERIVRRANAQSGDEQFLLEARHARHCLSRFWLGAPIDQLETLYAGAIGQVYRMLLMGVLPSQPLANDEQIWQQTLADRLMKDFKAPERINLLLAAMPYCQREQMGINEPAEHLPSWLLMDYASCFDDDLARQLSQPIGLLDQGIEPVPVSMPVPVPVPAELAMRQPEPSTAEAPPRPTAPLPVPLLSETRGQEGFGLFQTPEFVERMAGLINLYTIDRNDPEVRRELASLRRLIGQLWLDVSGEQLEDLYCSPMGGVFRSLLASDFGSDPLEPEDRQVRGSLTELAQDQGHPMNSQALLAAMLFYAQGSMELGAGKNDLPPWLQRDFGTLAGH